MNGYLKQVEAAILATTFHSPTTYSWFGKQSPRLPPTVKRALTPKTARGFLLFNLQSQLYNDFYCRGHAAPTERETPRPSVAGGTTPFVEALSAANSGHGYWEYGWEVRSVSDGKVVVSKAQDEPFLWARLEDCLIPQGTLVAPGTQLGLRFSKEFLGISPGFYMALSNQPLDLGGTQTLVRLYWNLSAEGAVPFMQHATSLLNRAELPFQLKVLNDPALFIRCDAAVVYIPKSDYRAVAQVLSRFYPEVATYLKPRTPAFTKPLAEGVGFAEDPGQSDSFGMHRCRILADGMIRAYEQDKKSIEERLHVVVDRFTEAGIDLDKPFVNPGSTDDYRLELCLQRPLRRPNDTGINPNTIASAEALLNTADDIGQRLLQEAVWHRDRCSWIGAEYEDQKRSNGHPGISYRTLGPDLYGGTSGVAVFLAELYATTRDGAVRRTTLGAIRQALSRVDAIPPSSRLGLYTGWVGIAFAAAHVGMILGEEKLLEHAKQLLRYPLCKNEEEHEFDLMSGNAGAIVGLLILRDILADTSLLDFALQLGDELLQMADKTEAGYSWRSAALPNQRHLTGFSHGTAGVGYALLELFLATEDSRYLRAAEQAFLYERQWFDARVGNWPDFREEPARGQRTNQPLSFATAWCHGAPGIALSRLRAYEVLKEKTYEVEATTALQTTRKEVETTLHSETGNFSLCHGLTGIAEVLLYGCRVLEQEQVDTSALGVAVANAGIETYAKRGLPWPCGIGLGETPSLMLGLAGIGYFYLRLHDPAIPSILYLRREAFLNRRLSTK